ncbi:hypothetical protein J6590_067100 [Homalodisca vitripennis]|nr:hypothetical protein J6590_067100 [Homalodisca vitripennis]
MPWTVHYTDRFRSKVVSDIPCQHVTDSHRRLRSAKGQVRKKKTCAASAALSKFNPLFWPSGSGILQESIVIVVPSSGRRYPLSRTPRHVSVCQPTAITAHYAERRLNGPLRPRMPGHDKEICLHIREVGRKIERDDFTLDAFRLHRNCRYIVDMECIVIRRPLCLYLLFVIRLYKNVAHSQTVMAFTLRPLKGEVEDKGNPQFAPPSSRSRRQRNPLDQYQ